MKNKIKNLFKFKNENKFFNIIPTFNCKYIERSIDSVINQSYKNWELIVIDNNSKNDVEKLIKNKKIKIRYFKINNNGIIGRVSKSRYKKSKYPWIAFLDSTIVGIKINFLKLIKKLLKIKVIFIIIICIYLLKQKFF